jgi:hypothetical protein
MMPMSKDERDRILQLLEAGQITAMQAAGLLDALATEADYVPEPKRERTLRLRATNVRAGAHKTSIVAAIPVGLIKVGLRLGSNLFPQLGSSALEDLLQAIERSATGRVLDVQDMEMGERLEIFVE